MARLRYGRGRSQVWLDGPLGEKLEDRLREVLGPIVPEMEKAAAQVIKDAQRNWPIQTGKSRDAFFTALTVEGQFTKVTVTILNRYDYVRYIRSTKRGKKRNAERIRSPARELVIKPSRKAARELKKVLPGLVAEAIERGVFRGKR